MIYGKNFSDKPVTEALKSFEIDKHCLKSLAFNKNKPKVKPKPDHFFRGKTRF